MATTRGATPPGTGLHGVSRDVSRPACRPVPWSQACRASDTVFPSGTVAPGQGCPTQDETIRVRSGRNTITLDGRERRAAPGDVAATPWGIPHAVRHARKTPVRRPHALSAGGRQHPVGVVRLAAVPDLPCTPAPWG